MRKKPKKRRTVTTPRPAARASLRSITPGFLVLLALIILLLFDGNTAFADHKHDKYALIFGTVWGPDDRPLYGMRVKIRRADQKKARWQLYSDHNGEFAQRVPPGPSDYVVWVDLKHYKSLVGKELHQDGEVKVHIDNDERQDVGLHLRH
jgi:hypothetical protein